MKVRVVTVHEKNEVKVLTLISNLKLGQVGGRAQLQHVESNEHCVSCEFELSCTSTVNVVAYRRFCRNRVKFWD
jgi:hypothetical protein